MRNLIVTVLLIIVAILLATAIASAGKNDCTWEPPARYAGTSNLNFAMNIVPEAELKRACDGVFAKYGYTPLDRYNGCADRGTKEVFILESGRGCITEEAILSHELGHINGWSANHED